MCQKIAFMCQKIEFLCQKMSFLCQENCIFMSRKLPFYVKNRGVDSELARSPGGCPWGISWLAPDPEAARVTARSVHKGILIPSAPPVLDHWLRVRNVLRVPQYACGLLAARAECSWRAAIRVRIIGCACGMFPACRNTRADHWLRVRNVPRVRILLRVPQYVCRS